jgi:DNA repair exonuclease SbcCD ATPase subunit
MEVMMDSMHEVADNLNAIKDDITGLRTQQNVPKQDISADNLSSILHAIQSLSKNFSRLRQEVTNLKNQAPPPAPPVVAKPDNELRELVLEQSSRISKLASEMTRMQSQLGAPASSASAPQSLRQALAAAEHDIRQHLHTVQTFYHRSGKNINRQSAEKTADLIIALEQGLHCAQGGLQG